MRSLAERSLVSNLELRKIMRDILDVVRCSHVEPKVTHAQPTTL